jgi:hypothetical protein
MSHPSFFLLSSILLLGACESQTQVLNSSRTRPFKWRCAADCESTEKQRATRDHWSISSWWVDV